MHYLFAELGISISNCVSCRKRKQSRPFLTYSEAQFTRLAEAKLYHYHQEQRELREKHIGGRGQDQPGKCDNVYVKMSDINSGSNLSHLPNMTSGLRRAENNNHL